MARLPLPRRLWTADRRRGLPRQPLFLPPNRGPNREGPAWDALDEEPDADGVDAEELEDPAAAGDCTAMRPTMIPLSVMNAV